MSGRTNACSEIVRLWLEARHGFLVTEGVPVPVPYALSDIDFLALHPRSGSPILPNGCTLAPKIIVEAKDEHDWEPTGREFGKLLRADLTLMAGRSFVPRGAKGVKFSMLREEHFERAAAIFGTDDFDRLFVVHAIDPAVLMEFAALLSTSRIHWLTIPQVVDDLIQWYAAHARPAALRNTLAGDMLHLLVGYCGLKVRSRRHLAADDPRR